MLKDTLRNLGYSDCFVVSYFNDEKISVVEAQKLEGGNQN